jgi:hypothetical protein
LWGAARHAPQDLAPRLEEEWLADLSAHSGPLQQLRFALGCCWATQVIAHDPMVFGAAARGAVAGHGTLAAFSPEMGSPSSSRSTVIMLVLALHGAAVYALLTGLIHPPLVEAPPPPFQGSVIYAPIEPPVTPPGPKVSSTPWKAVAPIYVGPIYLPPLTGETSDAEKRPIQLASSQTRSVSRVLGGPGAGFPSTEIFYSGKRAHLRCECASTTAAGFLAILRLRIHREYRGLMPARSRWRRRDRVIIGARPRMESRLRRAMRFG